MRAILPHDTKHRRKTIRPDTERYLWAALRQKVKELGGKAFAINGTEDHVHLVVSIPPSLAVDDFVRDVKAYSSRVFKKHRPKFSWQTGYSAHSVSAWDMDQLLEYVARQKSRHARGEVVAKFELES